MESFDFDNILIVEKSYENILIYDSSYKTLIGAKPLRTRFSKVDEFVRACGGTRHFVLFGPEKYDAIYKRIRCLIRQKSGITYVFLIIMQESKLIHMILYLWKKH